MNKDIMNKIARLSQVTELKSDVVELGLVQDVDKLSTNYFKAAGGFVDSIKKIEKAQAEMTDEFIKSEKALSELDSTYQQLARNAKVLGLEVPSEAQAAYKSALASMKNDLSTYKKYKAK